VVTVRALRALLLTLALGAAACARDDGSRQQATVLFLSDFGETDGAVAACKGVMWSIAPELRIVDLSHDIPPYDIETAAEVLEQAVAFYPSGTVVVAVVDPGVGSERRATAIRTQKGHLLVGPDNGLFTLLIQTEGFDRAVELRNARYFRDSGRTSSTFHGRDIFAPVAAHLAAGVPLDSLGPSLVPVRLELAPARRLGDRIEGTVRYIEDPYGNVVTNIPATLLDALGAHVGDSLEVRIGTRTMRLPWRNTFSDVPPGEGLALMHSRGVLSFSVNQGSFAHRFGVERRSLVALRPLRPSRTAGSP
jgi:S-adenosylmethionine hydrolase